MRDPSLKLQIAKYLSLEPVITLVLSLVIITVFISSVWNDKVEIFYYVAISHIIAVLSLDPVTIFE